MQHFSDLGSITTWPDIRKEVQRVNPRLAKIIDHISPDDSYKILRVKYPYGATIYDSGVLCLPGKDNIFHRIDSDETPLEIRKMVDYSNVPLTLQLKNGAEVFSENKDGIYPLNVYQPGDLYGLYGVISKSRGETVDISWSLTAGSRSAFFLSKILETNTIKSLLTTNHLPPSTPLEAFDHWKLFEGMAKNNSPAWYSEVLIFDSKWFEHLGPDKFKMKDLKSGWFMLYSLLTDSAWEVSEVQRNIGVYKMFRKTLIESAEKNHLEYNFFLQETVDHFLAISEGVGIGYSPCINSEVMLPAKLIEEAFLDVYKGKNAPIIFIPSKLNHNSLNSIYYSFSHPTFIAAQSTMRKTRSIIDDVGKTKVLVDELKASMANNENLYNKFFKNRTYTFFHTDGLESAGISPSSSIPYKDPILSSHMATKWKDFEFPQRGPFVRACFNIKKTE